MLIFALELLFLLSLLFSDAFHKQPIEIDLTLACIGELNTTIRSSGVQFPILFGAGNFIIMNFIFLSISG